MIKIEKAKKNEIKELNLVHIKTFKETYENIYPKEFLEKIDELKLEKKKIDSINRILVAKSDNKIVGLLIYNVENRFGVKNYSEIELIYILKEFQNMGIGKKLFYKSKKYLKENILVFVQYNNYKAINFYHSLGFKMTNEILEESFVKVVKMILE